jgi:alkanesulfonate monooxygenase SsuD/methylene tetrahydromethanopterin reductase-like flavin-dependent oxidoreductase (luciferase family)
VFVVLKGLRRGQPLSADGLDEILDGAATALEAVQADRIGWQPCQSERKLHSIRSMCADLDAPVNWNNNRTKGPWEVAVAASGNVEFGCVVAAAGAPGVGDHELYRDMLTDCELFAELGFGTAWVLEHHFSDYFPVPDPVVLISHLAGRFPELGFGTCVIVTPWHNPLRLAGQIAMLTQLTDQPLHLGLGRGTAKLEYDSFGLDMAEARDRFAETWEILRLAMAGKPFTYSGKYLPVPEAIRIRPEPRVDKLHFYGAIGSPDSAAIMAGLGLPPICNTIGDLDQQAKTLRTWADAAAAEKMDVSGTTYPLMIDCIVADTDDEAVQEACLYKPRFMQAQIDHYAPHATDWANTPGYQAWQRIFAGMEKRTRPENIVPWCEWQLVGSPETVRRKLERYIGVGFNHIILHFSTPGTPADVRRRWADLFAADVAPHFTTRAAGRSAVGGLAS